MKTIYVLLILLSFLLTCCSTEPEKNKNNFVVKVDKIELAKEISLGDTLLITFYGTIGYNGGFSFDRLESSVVDNKIYLRVWGKYIPDSKQATVEVLLDGYKYSIVPSSKGIVTVSVRQPDNSVIESNVVVK